MNHKPTRLAIVVSHPIQYYAPLYQRLAIREDVEIKVFFTWHGGQAAVLDHGFRTPIVWDIPLTEGYAWESVPNESSDPGTHHFFGLRNPSLVERVMAWGPDVVQVTGWAWLSHLLALRAFNRLGVPTLFRGDSHLLDDARSAPLWPFKYLLLKRVFSWPTAFLYVGEANRAYYEAFGIERERLFRCPHSIDVARFAQPAEALESEARQWLESLGIGGSRVVLLFAGKFEEKKRPVQLMRAIQSSGEPEFVLIMVGGGQLEDEVKSIAAADPDRIRVLPFQNQSRMPVVYRLGNLLILPSAYGETWGLAVNEAMACARPVLVSDRVGCAADMVDDSCGRVFPWHDFTAMTRALHEMTVNPSPLREMGLAASRRAWGYDIASTESTLVDCLSRIAAK